VGAELEAILKGREIPTPVRLAPGESRFPTTTPPAAAPQQPQVAHNLPAQLTSFLGRECELAEIVELLETTRLLTLTGPPGMGKTRLSLQVAAEILDQFQDGAFFVDLAPIRDPGLVATTIAEVLGISESGGQPLLDTLRNALCHKHLLLLLDNFEQVIDAAPLVGELLSSSPGLKALITSREALRVYGEQEYPVPPLTLPDLDRAEPLHSLSQYEAVELFTRRARAVRPDFMLTEDNARAVAEICVRLDGLPLAIELAAARSTMLSPEMVRRRLDSRLGVLVAGPRDLPARQRTLRGAIDWSYDLLEPAEKTLFARLAVFQRGHTVEAVEAICSHSLTIGILEGLESLLNKNLLTRLSGAHEEPRFVMLEMIHEYARERLEAGGEAEDLRRRHAEYFLALAERAALELRGARQQGWFVHLRAEQDNLRAALAWSLGEGEAELGLRLVGALRDFWFLDGHSAEGLRWTERTLASAQDAPPAARAGALNVAGYLCFDTGDHEKAKTYSGEALAIYRELDDKVGSARALTFLSASALPFLGECKEGIALCQEGLALFREAGHKPGIMQALTVLGELGRVDGDYDLAQKAYEECLALSHETGDKVREAITLRNLGCVAQYRGLPGKAGALFAKSLALLRELGDKKFSAMNLAGMSGPVAAQGYPQAAARLLGASEALLGAMGIVMHAGDWPDLDRDVAAVREQLDEATFDAAWAEGRAMLFEQAFSYALEWGELAAAAPPPGSVREPEIAVELPAFLEGEEEAFPSPVFVARERELALLDGYLDQALSGQGRVAFVTGEAGQGKTALVGEFARRAQAAHPDLIVAGGDCNAHTGIGDPYLPFREILGLLTGDVQDRWAARAIGREQARRLWQALPLTVQALVEAGPDLIDLLVPGRALLRRAEAFTPWPGRADWLPRLEELVQRKATIPGDPSLQQSALFEQYTRVLGALAGQRPLLLVLDDLQWVDGGSTNLLFHLGRRIQGNRILIVGAYRPAEVALGRMASPREGGRERHPLEPVINEFRRQFGAIEVDLGQAEDRQFVEALLDSEPNRLGDAFRETLYRQTRGHALSTVELLRDMQERGDLVQDSEGRWVEGQALDWEALPTRVEAVIADRLGRLAEPARELLRVASVEGETFTAEVVARVLGANEREVVRQLGRLDREHRLVGAQGMRRVSGGRLSLYRFRHILFQRYLYNSLGEGERAYLHEDVGTGLEALYGEATEVAALQLARHFQEAGIARKAVGYLIQAGDQARQQYANEEAIHYFRRALALLEDAPPDASRQKAATELYERLGDVLELTGQYDEARAAYQSALASLPARDQIGQGRLYRKTGDTWRLPRRFEKAMQAYDQAETALGQEPAEVASEWWQEWVEIQLEQTNVHYFQDEVRDLTELVKKIRPVVEQHGTPLQRVDFFLRLVLANNRRDRFIVSEQTLTHSRAYLEAAQELGSLYRIAHARFVLGFNLLWRGEFDQAKEQLNAALEMMVRMGHTYDQTQCLTYLTIVYRKLGQVEEAMDYALRSLEAATSVQNPAYIGAARANLAWVAWRKANLTEALENGKAALGSWQQSETGFMFQWLALYPLISIALDQDRIPDAVEYARGLLEPAQQAIPGTLEASLGGAIEAWERGEPEAARTHFDRAIELALEMAYL
jgi:predicted ATPase